MVRFSDPLSQMLQQDAGKSLRQRIDERNAGCPTWRVVVFVEGNRPEVHTVRADREGMAKTLAMMLYTQNCDGKLVEYQTHKLS